MRKVLGFGTLALSLLAYSLPAAAASKGWYVSGNAGFSTLMDGDFQDVFPVAGVSVTAKGESEYDTGFGISGAVGRSWGKFRLEGEFSYRKNDLDKLTITSVGAAGVLVTGVAAFALEGDVTSLGLLANVYYDFGTGKKWVPFVMGGIGGAIVGLDVTSIGGAAVTYDESDEVLALQIGGGIAYNISPTTAVNLSYRYFRTADPTFDDGVDVIDSEYQSHNLLAVVTYAF